MFRPALCARPAQAISGARPLACGRTPPLHPARAHGMPLQSALWRGLWRRFASSETGKAPARASGGVRTFRDLGLSEDVARAVEERLGFTRPTGVQAAAIPRLLRGDSLAFSSATGTGKTLAYVLPAVARLRADEAAGIVRRPHRPRALIIVPSRELALQVGAVVRDVCRLAPLATAVLHGGTRRSPQHEKLEGALDVVVATPGRLAELRAAGRLFVTDVRCVVLDEADTLYDDSFRADVAATVAPLADMARGAQPVQFVAVGATLPPALLRELQAALPRLAVLAAPPLATVRHLRQSFVHVQQGEKQRRLVAALREQSADAKSLVFCNTVASARSTEHALREAGIAAASLHGLVPPRRRADEWERFTSGDVRVLVCTDLAARGLDERAVAHVVLFDFPRSVLDYVHRVGRTARADRPGAALAFVTKRDRPLAQAIERAVQKRSDLWRLVSAPPVPGSAPSGRAPPPPPPRWRSTGGSGKLRGERVIVPADAPRKGAPVPATARGRRAKRA